MKGIRSDLTRVAETTGENRDQLIELNATLTEQVAATGRDRTSVGKSLDEISDRVRDIETGRIRRRHGN